MATLAERCKAVLGKTIKAIAIEGEEYEAFVAAIDPDKGITMDALYPEKLEVMGYAFRDDGPHMYCLNINIQTRTVADSKGYLEEFEYILSCIEKGFRDGRILRNGRGRNPVGAIVNCAFR